jgi:hypothetical protein
MVPLENKEIDMNAGMSNPNIAKSLGFGPRANVEVVERATAEKIGGTIAQINQAQHADGVEHTGGFESVSRAQAPTGEPEISATPAQKKLIGAYEKLLGWFYSGQITGEMLAADKSLALHLEQALQMEQRFFQLMANIAKMQHETLQGIIGNMRG